MGTLETAYKILYSLEHSEKPEYMGQIISPEKLGVSGEAWLRVLKTLIEDGYIAGVEMRGNILGETEVDVEKARITLKGADFLHNNSAFAKFRNTATNVIRVVADVAKIVK